MKKLFFVLCFCLLLSPAWGATTQNSCYQFQTGVTATILHLYVLPNRSCVVVAAGWQAVDAGTTSPSFQWSAFDAANVTEFAPGFSATFVNSSGTVTGTIASGAWTFTSGQIVYLLNAGNCNGAQTLTAANATQIQFSSSCTGTVGNVEDACGSGMTQGSKPCGLVVSLFETINNGIAEVPPYPFLQSYANTACSNTPWTANTKYGLNACVINSGTYYHNTAIGTNGYCSEGSTFGSVCSWANDGAANAILQDVATGTGFTGDSNAPPSSAYTNGGVIWNANSNICGSGGTSNCGTVETGGAMPAAFPLFWEAPFRYALKNFCSGTDGTNPGMLPHYNATIPSSQLLALWCGSPYGQEWYYPLYAFTTANYSLSYTQFSGLFISYASNDVWSNIHAEWLALGSPAWGMLVPDGTYGGCSPQSACNTYSDLIASASLAYAENSPGYLSYQLSDLTNYAAGAAIPGDWINIAKLYPNTKYHVMEISTTCPPVPCPGTGGGYSASQVAVGSLNQLGPFLTQHIVTGTAIPLVIVFGVDVACAYDASFSPVVGGGTYVTCPNTPYVSAFANMAAGVPSVTSGVFGGGGLFGRGSVQ